MTKSQKKIFVKVIGICFVFFILFVVVLVPMKKKAGRLSEEWSHLESQINQVHTSIGRDQNFEEQIIILQKKIDRLESKILQKEEAGLRKISDLAKAMQIDIISVSSQPKKALLNAQHQEVKIDGRVCQKVSITVEIKSYYKDLLDYIGALKETLPVFMTVERLNIKKGISPNEKLTVSLNLDMYLL